MYNFNVIFLMIKQELKRGIIDKDVGAQPCYTTSGGKDEIWLCLSAWQHTAESSNTLVILILGIYPKEKRHQRRKDIMSSYGLSF